MIKINKVGISFTLFILALTFIWNCNFSRPEKEIYLIPEGYTGIQYVLFEQEEGVSAEYNEKGNRIYRLNNTGLFRTQFKPNFGGFDKSMRKFYYVNSQGEKVKKINWISLMFVHHEVYKKDTIRFNDDSLLVFSLSVNPLGAELSPPKGCHGIAFIVDTFKNRVNKYPEAIELVE